MVCFGRYWVNYLKTSGKKNWDVAKNSNLVRHEAKIQNQDCFVTEYKLNK